MLPPAVPPPRLPIDASGSRRNRSGSAIRFNQGTRAIVSKRNFRAVSAFVGGLAIAALPWLEARAQLPFDPAAIEQLTPEQRQRALEAIGSNGGSGAAQASPDGRFRDQKLATPETAVPNRRGSTSRSGAGSNGSGGGSQRDRASADDLRDEGSDADADFQRDARSTRSREATLELANRDYALEDRERRRLRPFGYDLFETTATTFAPATDIPVPADYVVGPGDSVRVQLFGNENGNYSLQVARDGQINFPKLGPIAVAGQRFEDVRKLLTERIGRELIGVQSSITLGELRSVRVFLLGDVNQPGSYTVSSLSTITNAIFVGGGISPVGSLRNIELKRNGRLVQKLDLYALLLRGDSSADVRLQPGDVIFVPPVGPRVSADGEVKRPAIYELNGEKTIADVVSLAGGLLASTNTSTAQIERFDGNRKSIRQIDLAKAGDLGGRVQSGDVLRFGQIAAKLDNNVRVLGYVKYPGNYQWKPESDLRSVLQQAEIQNSDSQNEAYLPLGLIERTAASSGVRGWVGFSIRDVMLPDAAPFPLQRDDRVIILTRDDVSYLDSREVRAVAAGEVTAIRQCPALESLAELANTERAARFLKAFTAESTRTGASARDRAAVDPRTGLFPGERETLDPRTGEPISARPVNARCPAVYRAAPRALQYLLEESVAMYGEVRRPGLYPIARGTPLPLLIDAAGGLSNESDPRNIEYISYTDALKNGRSAYQTLDLKSADSAALKVAPGDVFNFKPLYLGQEVGTARVSGEFRFPGSYGILRGERLSQLIKRAGGLTSNAYPYGAVFTRQAAREAERESYKRAANDLQEAVVTAVTSGALGKEGATSAQFLSTVISRLQTAEPVGRVVIEADPTILEARPELDPIVEPGDLLTIPKRPITITVIGQVLNPGTQAFVPGTTLKQYIERAGGYSQAADDGRVFVILPNGTAQKVKASFWNYTAQDIPPGSLIVVPRDAAPFNVLALSERVFGLLSNLALSAAALATISRN